MSDITSYLHDLISQTLSRLDLPDNLVIPQEITLERPMNSDFGDYSTNVAMDLFSQLKGDKTGGTDIISSHEPWLQNPRVLAAHIVEQLQHSSKYDSQVISSINVAGPGFINFTLALDYLLKTTSKFATGTPKTFLTQSGQGKKVVVEYSSPNIAKPFTIGHLRSTIIGDAVANILSALGWEVFRDNHLGDWGTQFGKQIYAIKHLGAGSQEANIKAISESENPVKVLVELYVEFHQKVEAQPEMEDEARAWFQKLEAGDPEARELWQLCIDWSLVEFKRIYQQLGVTFTENPANGHLGYGESFFEDKMGSIVEELEQKDLLQEGKEGAKLIFFPNDQYPPLMILKKDGATLYATRDLATDKWRLGKYGPDIKVVNEVGAEQAAYFQQLFKAEELLGWYQPGQRVHVKHGLYRFKDKKMSTRKGNVIWLEDVLEETTKRAAEMAVTRQAAKTEADKPQETIPEDTSSKIGIGALKWNDLKRSSHLDVIFDWDEIINLKGNSGPYLQYTYVRAQSILTKADTVSTSLENNITKYIDTSAYSMMLSEKAVMRELVHFNETVQLAAKEFAPHYISTYLYQLAQSFNTFYTECPILGEGVSPEARQVRLQLTRAVSQVLATGLGLLGIETVDRM